QVDDLGDERRRNVVHDVPPEVLEGRPGLRTPGTGKPGDDDKLCHYFILPEPRDGPVSRPVELAGAGRQTPLGTPPPCPGNHREAPARSWPSGRARLPPKRSHIPIRAGGQKGS